MDNNETDCKIKFIRSNNGGEFTSKGFDRDRDEEYHLITYCVVRFRNKIYVSNNSELRKIILREFHVKLYSGHPGYQKTLKIVNKLFYCSNLKKEVVDFVARCMDCHKLK